MRLSMIALLTLGLTAPALAHDDATMDAMVSPHGGQLRMAGPYHFELVVGEHRLSVYLSDHAGQPMTSQGASGNAIVLSGGKTTVELKPAGESVLEGRGDFTAGPDMKVVVSLAFPDGNTWQARFTPGDRMRAHSTDAPAPAATVGGHRH